ncbi:unnamed protein product [Adineta ricciae]|uniref:G-protein coupled receptors family 1 profile domain-containing protein n=1 Tax=Adineta ricciae TaxID=249248 RepID=A0A815E2E5_ADIRI|nr:unnamed protein product [Adineta ricciae]
MNGTNFPLSILDDFNTRLVFNSTTPRPFLRLFNSTRLFPYLRAPLTTTPFFVNKYFMFKSPFTYIMRCIELCILSLTLPLYAIVLILFIELTVIRTSSNTAVSGGNSRSRTQRRRQHLRSLIWTSNYLLVDLLNLLYEVIYVIIHLSGQLRLKSLIGSLYCQFQVYVSLYLTVLMSYSLTAISIYRRRHFVNLTSQGERSNRKSAFMISSLWLMPMITLIFPTFLLVYSNILKITQHETTNQCQISYTYESNMEALYIFYRLGNIFLLPISISLACYVTIYTDLIRTQRRFNRAFKRHLHIRKNLITQILFLFLNFAVFWLPAEIVTLHTKNLQLKDAFQVTKCLNILLDPLIVTVFDTRLSSAGKKLLSTRLFDGFRRCFNSNRQFHHSIQNTSTRRPKRRLRRSYNVTTDSQQITTGTTWNMGNNDDITVVESISDRPTRRQRSENRRRTLIQKRKHRLENHV